MLEILLVLGIVILAIASGRNSRFGELERHRAMRRAIQRAQRRQLRFL